MEFLAEGTPKGDKQNDGVRIRLQPIRHTTLKEATTQDRLWKLVRFCLILTPGADFLFKRAYTDA